MFRERVRRVRKEELLEELVQVGWRLISGEEADRLRRSESGRLLREYFAVDMLQQNPETMDQPQVEELAREIEELPGSLAGNRETWRFLQGFRRLSGSGPDQDNGMPLRVLDSIREGKGSLHVCTDFQFTSASGTIYPDMVFFLSGIPLLVLQVGSGADQENPRSLHDELRAMRTHCPEFFATVQLTGAVAGGNAYYGCVWLDPEEGPWAWHQELAAENEAPFFLHPRLLADLLRDMVLFAGADGEDRKLILRPHQLETMRAVERRVTDPEKRRGLVWQAQGSGKSTALLAAGRYLTRGEYQDARAVLVLLDPQEAQEHLQDLLEGWQVPRERILKMVPELDSLIARPQTGLWVSLLSDYSTVIARCQSPDVVVLVDEVGSLFHQARIKPALFQALPRATFIGFTGYPRTPGEEDEIWLSFGLDDLPRSYLQSFPPEKARRQGVLRPVCYVPDSASTGSAGDAEVLRTEEEGTASPLPEEFPWFLSRVRQQMQTMEPRVVAVTGDRETAGFYRQALEEKLGSGVLVEGEQDRGWSRGTSRSREGVVVLSHYPPRPVAEWRPGCMCIEGALEPETLTYLESRLNRWGPGAVAVLRHRDGLGETPTGFLSWDLARERLEQQLQRVWQLVPGGEAGASAPGPVLQSLRGMEPGGPLAQALAQLERWYESLAPQGLDSSGREAVARLMALLRAVSWAYPESGIFPRGPALGQLLQEDRGEQEFPQPGVPCLCASRAQPPRGDWCGDDFWRFFCRRGIIMRSLEQENLGDKPFLVALWPRAREILDEHARGLLMPQEGSSLLDVWVEELQRARRAWLASEREALAFALAWRLAGHAYRRRLRAARRMVQLLDKYPRWPANARQLHLLRQGLMQALIGAGRTRGLDEEAETILEMTERMQSSTGSRTSNPGIIPGARL